MTFGLFPVGVRAAGEYSAHRVPPSVLTRPFTPNVFWDAFRDVGFLKFATVDTGTWSTDVYVGYIAPDRERFGGSGRSRDYEIEYQADDLPDLREGHLVTIWADESKTRGVQYRVREAPFIHDGGDDDGTFMHALLTRR